jgi:hypothetical protein
MRRFAIFCLPLIALAVPATALALGDIRTGDGTLVVKNGSAPRGVTVVTLSINGTAIGHVSTGSPDQVDKVVIYDANNTNDIGASATNGQLLSKTVSSSEQTTKLVGSDFRFRAAGGVYKIWIYGSGVDLFAVGGGKVTLQGLPDSSTDGRYAINGGDWHSLPAVPSDLLQFGSSG